MKLGLFIGRLNPPHNGHLSTIDRALQENDSILLLLGTPRIHDEKNPLSFEERKELLQIMFPEKNIIIQELLDTNTDEEWIFSIVEKIQHLVPDKAEITFYGGDFANDSAYKSCKEFEYLFSNFTLKYKEFPRLGTFVQVDDMKYNLSATNFREVLDMGNSEIAKQFTSEKIFKKIENWYHKK